MSELEMLTPMCAQFGELLTRSRHQLDKPAEVLFEYGLGPLLYTVQVPHGAGIVILYQTWREADRVIYRAVAGSPGLVELLRGNVRAVRALEQSSCIWEVCYRGGHVVRISPAM